MPDTDLKGAVIAAERIRAAVSREPLPEVQGRKHLSCTLGVAEHHKGENTRLIIARAEAGLIYAKAAGRDRVVALDEEGRPALVGGTLMADQGEIFMLHEDVVFRDRPMRVSGRVQLEGASGQLTFRYVLSDPTGAPVLLEEGEGRFALLRPFPPAARFKTVKDTVLVGTEKYTLVGVRKLKLLDASGNIPGAAPKAPLILSGMFEGLMGTLMRELVPGTKTQVYYLLKPLADGEIMSAAKYAAGKDAAARAAGERALDGD